MLQNFTCPYCGVEKIIDANKVKTHKNNLNITLPKNLWTKKNLYINYNIIVCPNKKCNKLSLKVAIEQKDYNLKYITLQSRNLLPNLLDIKLPKSVPLHIKEDFYEACLVKDISPKSSAMLSRRCLQSIIRDYWCIEQKDLHDEIRELKDKIPWKLREIINSIRKLGNISVHAHRKDYIPKITSKDANHLIILLKLLLETWYIKNKKTPTRIPNLIDIRKFKKPLKKTNILEQTKEEAKIINTSNFKYYRYSI